MFAAAIVANWKSFSLNEPYQPVQEVPKPTTQPVQTGVVVPSQHKGIVQKKKLRSFQPESYEPLDYYPDSDRITSFDFYGQNCEIEFSSSLLDEVDFRPSSDFVSDFWSTAGDRSYQKLVNDLLLLKRQLKLPGFGFYIMIRDFTANLGISEEEKVMYQWFLLSKAGYNTRVGFYDDKPFLIVASETKIFGHPYFTDEGITYYIFDNSIKEIETYSKVNTKAVASMDFVFERAPDLPLRPDSKSLQFTHGQVSYEWEIYYNRNVVDMLETFPHVDLPSYFNSRGSYLLEQSLKKEIEKDIKDKTQVEIVSLLLSFTQKAFEYQTDQIQFGREKIFFPDQFIYYDKSDCDDRVVFFNYLLELFTEVQTIALLFPQHIALGAKLPIPSYGETIDYAGNRFIFCDPTYHNAAIGTVIPQADRSQIKILSY